jgi:hypothetical protein
MKAEQSPPEQVRSDSLEGIKARASLRGRTCLRAAIDIASATDEAASRFGLEELQVAFLGETDVRSTQYAEVVCRQGGCDAGCRISINIDEITPLPLILNDDGKIRVTNLDDCKNL